MTRRRSLIRKSVPSMPGVYEVPGHVGPHRAAPGPVVNRAWDLAGQDVGGRAEVWATPRQLELYLEEAGRA